MFRAQMAPNEGMVFVFDATGHYPFWMKNTLIPLDIVWVDQQFRVVHVAASVPPCRADPCPTYPPPPSPKGDALYVVEVVSGLRRAARRQGRGRAGLQERARAEARVPVRGRGPLRSLAGRRRKAHAMAMLSP